MWVLRAHSSSPRRSWPSEVILVDIAEGIPQGKGLDQWESAPIEGFDCAGLRERTTTSRRQGADIFIVTAGIARKPGMSRDDLLKTNAWRDPASV
jgi:malate dehydrogenase